VYSSNDDLYTNCSQNISKDEAKTTPSLPNPEQIFWKQSHKGWNENNIFLDNHKSKKVEQCQIKICQPTIKTKATEAKPIVAKPHHKQIHTR
jgi:hypothetical protein